MTFIRLHYRNEMCKIVNIISFLFILIKTRGLLEKSHPKVFSNDNPASAYFS